MSLRRRAIGSVVETVDAVLQLPIWCREHRPPTTELVLETFLADGTWTRPAGVTEATVEAWGAGGGGTDNTGGGGGGAYARADLADLDADTYAVTVGVGAAATDGGDSSFAALVVAKGGLSGGNGGNGGQASACTGDVAYDGGDGELGTLSRAGGGSAGAAGAASASAGGAPNGAPTKASTAPTSGNAPGGGGRSHSGVEQWGADGEVRVSYYQAIDGARPAVVGRTLGRDTASGTTHDISIPDGEVGDLLVLFWACDGDDDGAGDHAINKGWTRLAIDTNGTTVVGAVFYKVATGVDTPTVTTTDSEEGTWVVERYRNAGIPTATTADGSSTNADPPSHDGGRTAPHRWVAFVAHDYGAGPTTTAPPTGYDTLLRTPGRSNGAASATLAHKVSTAQIENPGAFTSEDEQWVAITVAIPYARQALYRAPQGLVTDEGYFALRLIYTPTYAHDGLGGGESHTLIEFNDTTKLYFDGDSATFVLDVDGVTLASDAVTFSAAQELTFEVEHTDERMRVRVQGATSGNSRIDGDPTRPAHIWSQIYLLGEKETGSPYDSTLVAFRPTNADTFAELVDTRLATQNDPGDANLRIVAKTIATRRGRIHDAALTIRDAGDIDHATGEELDIIGSVLVLPRNGFEDDRYRVFLNIQAELLLAQARDDSEWTGTCENLLRIARTFIGEDAGPIILTNSPPYAYQLDVPDLVLSEAEILIRFLTTATYAAVRGVVTAILGDNGLWDSVEEDIEGGWIWDAVEEDITGASVWGAVVTTTD